MRTLRCWSCLTLARRPGGRSGFTARVLRVKWFAHHGVWTLRRMWDRFSMSSCIAAECCRADESSALKLHSNGFSFAGLRRFMDVKSNA